MSTTPTANFTWAKPDVASESGAWGADLNAIFDAIDLECDVLEDAAAAAQVTANAALSKAGGTMTGRATMFTESKKRLDSGSISGAQALDLSAAEVFTATISGSTTFSIANVPAGTIATAIILLLTNGGGFTTVFPASFKWPGGVVPTLTGSGGKDLIAAVTFDGGTTWFATARLDLK